MQTLIACFSGGILKQATYVFRSNAEQSRLTALKKQKRKRARHMHFDARFCFYFFRAELGKRANYFWAVLYAWSRPRDITGLNPIGIKILIQMLPKSTSNLISTRFTRSQVYGQWFRFTLNVNKPPTFCKDSDFCTKVAHPRINYLNFSFAKSAR